MNEEMVLIEKCNRKATLLVNGQDILTSSDEAKVTEVGKRIEIALESVFSSLRAQLQEMETRRNALAIKLQYREKENALLKSQLQPLGRKNE